MTRSKLHGNGYINYCEDCDYHAFRKCNHPSGTRKIGIEESWDCIPDWCPLEDVNE